MSARRTVWPGLNHAAAAEADSRTVEILDLLARSAAGGDVDVLAMMRTLTARVIAEYCFGGGSTPHPRTARRQRGRHRAIRECLVSVSSAAATVPPSALLPRHRQTLEALTEIVRRRRASGSRSSQNDLLDYLLNADPLMPDRTVMSTLRGILMGGHGVPAAALVTMVRELASRPQLAADLRDEAVRSSGSDAPPAARLPLAEAVVKEVFRLYPPVWLMTRTAAMATTLGCWSLRPGDEVLLNPYLIHRDPRWWQSAR